MYTPTLSGSGPRSQGRTSHARVSFTISQVGFLLVTRVEKPMPQLVEQALHSVVCSMQLEPGSDASRPTVASRLNAKARAQANMQLGMRGHVYAASSDTLNSLTVWTFFSCSLTKVIRHYRNGRHWPCSNNPRYGLDQKMLRSVEGRRREQAALVLLHKGIPRGGHGAIRSLCGLRFALAPSVQEGERLLGKFSAAIPPLGTHPFLQLIFFIQSKVCWIV